MTALDPDRDALAAEFALGLLDGPERAAAERRLLAEPSFGAEVEAWRVRLASLTAEAPSTPPPAGLWGRIEREIGHGSQGVNVSRLRRGLLIWRSVSAASAALAAGLAVALLLPRPEAARSEMMTARLSPSPQAPATFVALYDPGRQAIILTPAAVHAIPGHAPELWLIPAGGKPVALGVATFGGSVRLVSTAAAIGEGTLAVSIEPEGGSPTGQPTGPVVATGQLVKL